MDPRYHESRRQPGPLTRKSLTSKHVQGSLVPLAKKFFAAPDGCASACPAVTPNVTIPHSALALRLGPPHLLARRASAFSPAARPLHKPPFSSLHRKSITPFSPFLPSTHIATIYLGIAIQDGCTPR
jgi:hypothetical protein